VRAIKNWSLSTARACGIAFIGSLALGLPSATFAQDSVPDFHGLWLTDGSARDATRIVDGRLPDGTPAAPRPGSPSTLTEEGRNLYERNKAGIAVSDPTIDQSLLCIPSGFPRIALNSQPVLIMQEEDVVVWTSESNQGIARRIWISDQHTTPWPSRLGDSIARWDGDTLIVETTDISEDTLINSRGLGHSTEFTAIERWRLIDNGAKLEIHMTFTDPVTFTEPWDTTVIYERSDQRPLDDICTDPVEE